MALSNNLKTSIQEVLSSKLHIDTDYINNLIKDIETFFYSKRGVEPSSKVESVKPKVQINESVNSIEGPKISQQVLGESAKSCMKDILNAKSSGTGLAKTLQVSEIKNEGSAKSAMKSILL